MNKVSFIIANYNYEKYVAQAISSALASNWPDLEVIVVDDGSKDGSRAVIESFGDRIKAIFQENQGQRTSNNTGFAASTGDIIMFLDADDVVHPELIPEVMKVWRPGISKVQVQMITIDAKGAEFGEPFPAWDPVPTPAQIRSWAMTNTEYPTPPQSGNVFSREFVNKIFPVGPEHDSSTDSTTLALSPLLGEVVTLRKPLTYYRRHGANDSSLSASDVNFAREVSRALQRQKSATEICQRLGVAGPPPGIVNHSWYVLQLRAGSLRLKPEAHPMPETHFNIALDAIGNIFRDSYEPLQRRVKIAAWVLIVLAVPQNLARKLMMSRFGG